MIIASLAPQIPLLSELVELLTSQLFIWLAVLFIAAYAVIYWLRLEWSVRRLHRETKQAIERLKSYETSTQFRKGYRGFNAWMEEQSSALRHSWMEFAETLIFDEDPDVPIQNTHPAGLFFSPASVRDASELSKFRSIPNNLLGFGILATFLGLAAGVTSASSGLMAQDSESLMAALESLLRGAGLAFTTSVFGLATSIAFSKREQRLLHLVSRRGLSELSDALDARLTIITIENIAVETLDQQRQQTAQLKLLNDEIAGSIAEALDAKLEGRLQPLFLGLQSQIEALREEGRDRSQLMEMVEEIKGLRQDQRDQSTGMADQITSGIATQIEEGLTTEIERAVGLISQTAEGLERSSQAFDGSHQQMGEMADQLRELYADLRTQITSFEQAASGLRVSVEAMGTVSTKMGALAEGMDENLLIASTIGQETSESAKALREAFARAEEERDRLGAYLASYQERFEGIDEQAQRFFQALGDNLDGYSSSVDRYTRGLQESMASAVQSVAGATAELGEAVEELSEVLEEARRAPR